MGISRFAGWKWGVLILVLSLSGCDKPKPEAIAIQRGEAFLRTLQRADGAMCDTLNPLFDIWETIEATAALTYGSENANDSILRQAFSFLKLSENPAGLICHNLKCRDATCLETTAEYFLLLAEAYGPVTIQNRIGTLITLQKPPGYWEVGNPDVRVDTAFPSVTGFMIAALQLSRKGRQNQEKAAQWLASKIQPEGHWGVSWEYYGCPAYAIWANMRALRGIDIPEAQASITKAQKYILDSQLPDGSWDKTVPSKRKVSPELQTALMLSALHPYGDKASQEAANKAVAFLLSHQLPDGSWDGGFFPIDNLRYEKKEYVFATARAVYALKQWSHTQSDHE